MERTILVIVAYADMAAAWLFQHIPVVIGCAVTVAGLAAWSLHD